MFSSNFILPLVGFAAGSIPFGLLVARWKGVDIRKHGSGNIGATNVLRVVGKPYGIAVFVFDFLKGLLPVLASLGWFAATPSPEWVSIATGLAAILGHNYSPWVGFKGGKGIATSAGVLLGLLPWPLLIALAVWGVAFKATRYVSVASMAAAVAIPCAEIGFSLAKGEWRPYFLGFTIAIAVLAIWRHRSNIQNLKAGREHRFESTRPPQPENSDSKSQ
ncbi:MAG: glycerol-3-phosphate 1-O-acyltransferase PlsY [Verrucomicrobiales bacterium]